MLHRHQTDDSILKTEKTSPAPATVTGPSAQQIGREFRLDTITLQGSKPAGRYTYSDNMDGLSARKLQLLAKSR